MKEVNKEAIEPFKVYIRIRPLLERELKQIDSLRQENPNKQIDSSTLSVENNIIYLKDPFNTEFYGKNVKTFPFDYIFKEEDQNKTIFDSIIKQLIDNILQGYNSTALAYGITGTGKTHTMFGDIYQNLNLEKGICMYSVDYLFDKLTSDKNKECNAKVSYLEIYNEQVIDLLTEKRSNEGLMLLEDPKKGVLVPELIQKSVTTSEEVLNYILIGNQKRTMGPTGQNQFSSRSHAILEISLEQKVKSNEDEGKEEILNSKITFVDLAGSERGGLEKGKRRDEGSNINKSLLALGNCINILSDKTKKGAFIPYRDSKLTRLLKDSLGGNIVTLMIACVTQSPMNYEETNSTLNYASRANKIEKKITRNVKEVDLYSAQYNSIITSLKTEIIQLKSIIRNQHILLQIEPNDSFREELRRENVNQSNDYFYNDNDKDQIEDMHLISDMSFGNNANSNKKAQPIVLNCNHEVYEHFLKINLTDLTEEEFEDFCSKMESLYFAKITTEEQIKQGFNEGEINERYIIIKKFYEKFLELIHNRIIENIEQIMIFKINLKEILQLNETNNSKLKEIESQIELNNDITSFEAKEKFEEELKILNNNIKENEREINHIHTSLNRSDKIKSMLKQLLLRFITNTQINEVKDLQDNYVSVLNAKKELEVKNKKYQEYLNSIIKEKDEKTTKITDLLGEIDKMRKQLNLKDKRILELEKHIRTIESFEDNHIKDEYNRDNQYKKTSIRNLMKYFNDCNVKAYFDNGKGKRDRRSTSRPYRRSNRSITNNFISINLKQNISTITAYIHGGDIFTSEAQANAIKLVNTESNKISINVKQMKKMKRNIIVKKAHPNKVEKPLRLQLIKSNSTNNSFNSELNYSDFLNKKQLIDSKNHNELGDNSILDLANNLKSNCLLNHNNIHLKQYYNLPMNNTKEKTRPTHKSNKRNINNENNLLDAISVSEVTFNNEGIINSSVLDMMNNVLSIQGIKSNIDKIQ